MDFVPLEILISIEDPRIRSFYRVRVPSDVSIYQVIALLLSILYGSQTALAYTCTHILPLLVMRVLASIKVRFQRVVKQLGIPYDTFLTHRGWKSNSLRLLVRAS